MKKQKIPVWVWVVIFALILVLGLFLLDRDDEINTETAQGERYIVHKSGTETIPDDESCLEQCGLNQFNCDIQVMVYDKDRDCYLEFKSCFERCPNKRTANEKMCLEQCSLNQFACDSMVRVLKKDYDCRSEFKSCFRRC